MVDGEHLAPFGMQSSGFRVQGLGCRALGFRVQGCSKSCGVFILHDANSMGNKAYKAVHDFVHP